MKKSLIVINCLLVTAFAQGQIAHGGEPELWNSTAKAYQTLPSVELLLPTELAPTAETKQQRSLVGFKYGEQLFTEVDILSEGAWKFTNSERICRFEVRSPGAEMISLQFSTFDLAAGAQVFIYNTSRSYFIGSFTKDNVKPNGALATAVVPGEALIIEFREPVNTNKRSLLKLGSITHGYLDIFDFSSNKDINPGYQSSPCHNNVICPIASAWQNEKRAVAMFLRPDGNGCTGSLLNNTANDGTPYFFFANHCYQANADQWVFYFNYESPGCVGNSGPSNQTISGATLRSNYYFDDFGLLELSSTPPANYNVYYAGWDRSGANPTSQTVIQHPLYDVKKITFDYDPAFSYAETPYVGAPYDTYMWGVNWDNGIVEPVASGSPLFDQNHRVIGHMYEGSSTCGGSTQSGFAKFSESWDGSSASTRLRDWLDPSNSVQTLDGYDPNSSPANVRISLRAFLEGPFDPNLALMNDDLRVQGIIPLSEPYTALAYPFVGGGAESINSDILNTSGNNAIVDWVVVELRDKNNAANIIASRAALIQRDGDIVDLDGFSSVEIPVGPDDHYLAIRHRNHLGVMLLNTVFVDDSPNLIDLTDGSVPVYGTEAMTDKFGFYALWSGDGTYNGELKYTGASNDRDNLLSAIGGSVPTAIVPGYFKEDANLDGLIKYTGANNDRDIILVNIGGAVPTLTRQEQLP